MTVIIFCPYCFAPITIDELGEHINSNPETKKQAIEHEIELWGEDAYDRNYLIQNVVFCPSCHKVSHFKDWEEEDDDSSSDNKEKAIT